jgi:hypothetical protein
MKPRSLVIALGSMSLLASAAVAPGDPDNAGSNAGPKNVVRMICGAWIECIAPDGRYARVALRNENDGTASVLVMEDDTISCPLREGDTIFLIRLPEPCTFDRFSFVNENSDARGELRIAVANDKLPATSAQWTPVDGSVGFANKRFFRVSVLGVEAKFVRVTFHVERERSTPATRVYGDRTLATWRVCQM